MLRQVPTFTCTCMYAPDTSIDQSTQRYHPFLSVLLMLTTASLFGAKYTTISGSEQSSSHGHSAFQLSSAYTLFCFGLFAASAAAACSVYSCLEGNSKPVSSSASAVQRVSISGFSAVAFVLMAVATIFTFVSFDSPFWSQGESGLHDVTVSVGVWQFHEGFNLPSDLGSSLLGKPEPQLLSFMHPSYSL